MRISNFDHIDIIGGNVSGLVAGIELTKKGIPYTIYEKGIWDKPCGGAFGQDFHQYLNKNGISIEVNPVTSTIFASKYVKMEEIPYKFYITKRKHLQEELLKKIPKQSFKMEKIDKKNIDQLSKVIFVATGISGLSKYLLNKDFANLGRYQYFLLKGEDYPAWDPKTSLFYWIPEIKGYAWVFPTINGFVDIGIGGFVNTDQKKYYRQFLHWLNKNYDLKNPNRVLNKPLVSWGIPMWSNTTPKKVVYFENKMKQIRVGIGDAVDLPQIVSAGGIENAIIAKIY
jgi:flavin-dependent dehydrogenase